MRGAWIEIGTAASAATVVASLPVRGAWIEMTCRATSRRNLPASLPVRGAWIEIASPFPPVEIVPVAPRAGSVD